jgi:hypothetical protein
VTPRAHYFRGFWLGSLVFFGGFVVLAVAVFVPMPNNLPIALQGVQLLTRQGVPDWLAWLGFLALAIATFGLSVGGAEFTRWAFRRLVPAECPQCGGNAYGQGSWPVTYVCRCCGHVHDTGIREGEET